MYDVSLFMLIVYRVRTRDRLLRAVLANSNMCNMVAVKMCCCEHRDWRCMHYPYGFKRAGIVAIIHKIAIGIRGVARMLSYSSYLHY